jgi:hypothetical protein
MDLAAERQVRIRQEIWPAVQHRREMLAEPPFLFQDLVMEVAAAAGRGRLEPAQL